MSDSQVGILQRRMAFFILFGLFMSASTGMAMFGRQAEQLEALLTKGRASLQDGLYDHAETYLREYVTRVPTDPDKINGYIFLSEALYRQQEYAAVTSTVQQAEWDAASPTQKTLLMLWSGRAQLALNNPVQALADLERIPIPMEDPKLQMDVDRIKARALIREGMLNDAEAALLDFNDKYHNTPDNAGNLLDLVSLYIQRGDRDKGNAIIDIIEQTYPGSETAQRAQLWRARMISEDLKFDAAAEAFTQLATNALVLPAIRGESWLELARVYEQQKHWTNAMAALTNVTAFAVRPAIKNRAALLNVRILIEEDQINEGLSMLHQWLVENASDPLAGKGLLDTAQLLLNKGANDKAEQEFQNYLETHTNETGTTTAFLGKAWSLARQNRYGEAAGYYDKAYERLQNPQEKREALINAADALFATKKYEDAASKYLEFTRVFPQADEAPHVLYQYSECLAAHGDPQEALKKFQSVYTTYTNSEQAQMALLRVAALQERMGNLDGAITSFNTLLSDYPSSSYAVKALHGRAIDQYRLGLFPEALEGFERVISEFPDDPHAEQAFYMKAWTLYLMNRTQEAVAICQDFISQYPQSQWSPDVLFWLGEYYYNAADYPAAENSFSNLNTQYSSTALADDALYWAGRAAAEDKQYLKAISYYNQLAQQYPTSARMAETRFAQGDALSSLGKYDGAILAFDEIIKNYNDSYLVILAHGRKGDCQFTLGAEDPKRYEEAIASYELVLNSGKTTSELRLQALYKLGRCQEKTGRVDEAFKTYMDVVYDYMNEGNARTPNAAIWFTRSAFNAAAISEQQKRWKQAVAIYRRVVDAGVPAANEAKTKSQQIQFEHWVF